MGAKKKTKKKNKMSMWLYDRVVGEEYGRQEGPINAAFGEGTLQLHRQRTHNLE